MLIWGIPGAGKSEFAKWLSDAKGYVRVDNDEAWSPRNLALPHLVSPLMQRWRMVPAGLTTPAAFVDGARRTGLPVVVEYGQWAEPARIDLLGQLQAAGADTWWFGAEPFEAARTAWREQNRKSRPDMPDEQWDKVVDRIKANWSRIQNLFGPHRMLVTVRPGPEHTPVETIYETMASLRRR